MRHRAVWSFATILAVLPSLVVAQTGAIRGRVADSSGAPIPHAAVSVQGLLVRASSDDSGRYELRRVPAGTWTVRVRALGYQPATRRVTVTEGGAAVQDFSLGTLPVSLAAIDVVVGSHARHTAPDELAVPVDMFPAEVLQLQGTSETGQILQAVSPSVNFPHQSVTDATDIVRPFTLRGLSPDQTLVLLDGWRVHQMAVVNTFAYGMAAGSSGVDMNAIPASAIDRIDVLRDGASAQYGSDAIAGVVSVVTKQGRFAPFLNAEGGAYVTHRYGTDGRSGDVSGGVGLGLGRGSLALFGEFQDRGETNRAWADASETAITGVADSVDSQGRVVVKRNPVPQPNYHWGDGFERDIMTLANLHMPLNAGGTAELYGVGNYSYRQGSGYGYRRYSTQDQNWPEIYPLGFLPQYRPDVTDYSATAGVRGALAGWALDFGGSLGHNDFKYNLRNTLNQSLGPDTTIAMNKVGIPNQTSFFAGRLLRDEFTTALTASRALSVGWLPSALNVTAGVAYRREQFAIHQGEYASWVNGGDTTQSGGLPNPGSQVFAGFSPSDTSTHHRINVGVFAELESNVTPTFLANVAGRFESYSDFGERLTGKVALRYAPSRQITLRAAGSTGFRAPGLGQEYFSHIVTNVINGKLENIGVFPVGSAPSVALGAKPLRDETSVNLSGGVAVTPTANLTFTLDAFAIWINHRIILGATYDDDSSKAILARVGYPDIGGLQYFTNGIDTRTDGIDLTADWRSGALDLTAAVNHTTNTIVRVDPIPYVLRFSPHGGLLDSVTTLAITRERPDWRGTLTAQFTPGAFHWLLRGSYYGKFRSAQPGYCDQCGESYGEKVLVDAEVGYRLGVADLAIGARNLLDTYPDTPTNGANNNGMTFPYAAASPFGYNGRNLYTRVSVVLP